MMVYNRHRMRAVFKVTARRQRYQLADFRDTFRRYMRMLLLCCYYGIAVTMVLLWRCHGIDSTASHVYVHVHGHMPGAALQYYGTGKALQSHRKAVCIPGTVLQ